MRLVCGGSGPRNHCATLRVRAATGAGTLLLIFFQWGASCHGARLPSALPGKLESEVFISMSTRGSFEGRDEYAYGGTPAGSISSTMVDAGGVSYLKIIEYRCDCRSSASEQCGADIAMSA
jgi:hypothetical protein